MWRQLTADSAKLVYTYRMRTKDGGYLWVEAKARVVADSATGLPREVVSVIRDVSARVDEQQQLMVAYRQAQVLAKIDTLTGLANRRGFDDALQGEWRRAIRDNTHISLLMVDVDDFKSYNDVYGHPAGDACLQAIADILAASLQRSSDLAARYGGEEFAILLPNTHSVGATEIAERVRKAVTELYIEDQRRVARPNTVSIGIAVAHPRADGGQDELVGMADRALYAAKRQGKNRIVNSGSLDDAEVGDQAADPEPTV
jgi:diguanylate cyclase (GGDEF)-like protein